MIHTGLKDVSFSVTRFLRWWGGELAACLPAGWRRQWRQQDGVFWLSCDHDRLQAHPPRAGLADTVPLAEARRQACILLLPDNLCLRHQVELPVAVEAELPQVLRFELDRLTPFTPDQAYFDYRTLGRDDKRRLLQLELVLVARDTADTLLRQVNGAGLSLRQMTLLGADGEPEPFNLLPSAQQRGPRVLSRWINGLLLSVLLSLLAAWVLRPIYVTERQIDALQPQLSAARREAEAVRALKQQIAVVERGGAFLARQRSDHLAPLELLRELTLILPDDTWLQQLQLSGDEVTLQGQAPAAAHVVQVLESSPLLNRVSFRSPVVRDVRTGHESFFLAAKLVEAEP